MRVWRRRFLAEGRQGLADRPRHDLTHHQEAEATASAHHVLRELQKGGLPGLNFGLSTWMNASCIPTPTWQKSGSGAANR